MATTVFLIRHAAHDRVNTVLCGRMNGVHLGDHGRCQAAALARWMSRRTVAAIYTSPLMRAQETALALTPRPVVSEALTELDYGTWTGRAFTDLAADPEWATWNRVRAGARPPGGESMMQLRARTDAELARLLQTHADTAVALISHAEIIKTIIGALLRLSPDDHTNFDIDPASISTIVLWAGGGKVISLNETSFQWQHAG